MNFHDIDELLKKAILEAESKQDLQAFQSQQKVWDRIEKPKPNRKISWLYISTLAAAISIFLLATILYLKLDTTQKELMALTSEIEKTGVFGNDDDDAFTIEEEAIAEQLEVLGHAQETASPQKEINDELLSSANSSIQDDEIGSNQSEQKIPKKETIIFIEGRPEIAIANIEVLPVIPEPRFLEEKTKDKPEKNQKSGKLKFRFGGNPSTGYSGNTLAFNVKIAN